MDLLGLTNDDLAIFLRGTALITAKKLGVPDAEWMSTYELLQQIGYKDGSVYASLGYFHEAYKNWFEFHQKVDLEHKSGKLTPSEEADLDRLIKRKNKTRAVILEKLADAEESLNS